MAEGDQLIMMAISHGLVGTLIALAIPDPIIQYPVLVGSHLLMDVIPHWDFGTEWETRSKGATGKLALLDTAFAFIIPLILFHSQLPYLSILIAVSLANLPDWMEAPWFIFFAKQGEKDIAHGSILRKISYLIYKIQSLYFHTTDTFPHGIFTQIGFILFCFFLTWR